ncbi:MAG: hypothetical protein ACT4PT_13110 [Methanobacteriota archaeon]
MVGVAVIGAFARVFKPKERVLHVAELEGSAGYEVESSLGNGEGRRTRLDAGTPEAFIEEVEYEAGNVIVSPVLEALRQLFSKRRQE